MSRLNTASSSSVLICPVSLRTWPNVSPDILLPLTFCKYRLFQITSPKHAIISISYNPLLFFTSAISKFCMMALLEIVPSNIEQRTPCSWGKNFDLESTPRKTLIQIKLSFVPQKINTFN